ncbi:MAG TPA: hypothetical protein VFB61_13595 [Gemmatimonadales bacterium]|nr:hypothetical protein [Gemmatimonadales bacterium]
MIRVDVSTTPLSPAERYGLDVLIDLSRLLLAEQAECELVRITVTDRLSAGSAAADLSPQAALQRADGEVRISGAALRAVAEVAGGAIEQRSRSTDRHGRVPSAENPLVAAGQSRKPVVSLLAVELRRSVIAVAGRRPVRLLTPWPEGHRWAAVVTHDLDVVDWWGMFSFLRIAELALKGGWDRARQVARSVQRNLKKDPVARGIQSILQLEAHHGIRASWFLICADRTLRSMLAGDATYQVDGPAARKIVTALTQAGHEIGLHGSFATTDDATQMQDQRRRLARLTDAPILGVRQHFLRMQPGRTQRHMVQCGFEYDSTWGFADRNGFRLGVADPVPAWDAAGEATLPLDALPLIWMDRALSKYGGIEEPGRWVEDARDLMKECKAVEGVWVGLWHPNTTEPLGFPNAEPAFVSLLQALADDRPYFGTAHRVAQWRRFRRSVRASRVTADGRVLLTSTAGQRILIALEDESGETTRVQVPAGRSSGI